MRILVVCLALLAGAQGLFAQSHEPFDFNDVKAATDQANKMAGRTGENGAPKPVVVKNGGRRDGTGPIPVSQPKGAGPLGPVITVVPTGGTRTLEIDIWPHDLRTICPAIATPNGPDNHGAVQEVLACILVHEFAHMKASEGGVDLPQHEPTGPAVTGTNPLPEPCPGQERYQSDGATICARIQAVSADAALSAEEKCIRIKALCELLKYLQDQVNTPRNLALNCPNVDTTDQQIVNGCCPHCCSVEGGCSSREDEL